MWKRLLPIIVGLVLFALALRSFPLQKVWDQLRLVHWGYCPLILLCFLIMVYLKGIRWSFLLKMQGHRYSVWNCFLIYMASLFWGNVTPGRAGDFMKVLYLKRDLNLSIGTGMPSILVDRIFDLYLLLILGCLGFLVYPMPVDPNMVRLVWIFFGILVFASALVFNRRIGEVLIKAAFEKILGARLKEKANQNFEDFHKGMEAYYSPALLVPVLLSLASYVVSFSGCLLIAESMGLHFSIFYVAFCISIVNIVSLLTLLGMGTREWALKFLFALNGLTDAQAGVFDALLFLDGTILFSLLCFFCFLIKPIHSDIKP